MSRRTLSLSALVVAAVVLAVGLGLRARASDDGLADRDLAEEIRPDTFVQRIAALWAEAWQDGDVAAMQALAVAPATDLPERVASFRDGLRITGLRASPRPPESIDRDGAVVSVDVAVDLQALGTWTYTTRLQLVLPPDAESPVDWRVQWSRAALHPALTGDRLLAVTRTMPERAPLLAADGSPLTGPLLGRVGTAEEVGPARLVGDPKGVSGLQAAFDLELGGSASGEVQVIEGGAVVEVLARIDGRAPVAVQSSLDPRIQGIAEERLASLTVQPRDDEPAFAPNAAVVVLRPSTGEVLAVASKPGNGFNRALNGMYPPGSTFKIVTATALLTGGLTPDSPASCPEVATVNGRAFRNAEGAALGDIPFRRAFFESCNTAFVQLAAALEPAKLVEAATFYGFNAPLTGEIPVGAASFPDPGGLTEQASAAIGQGRVLATPLQMASVAATVASGAHRPVTFRHVVEPAPGTPLPAGVGETLRELMRLVVAQGTGTAAQLPGAPVHGKTGTAEFGTEVPPRTHAWFVGFRGDVAIAVLVEDGGFGGAVSAPLAREVLRAIG